MFKKINSETSGGANRQKRLIEEDLMRGDHIYVRRGGLLYSHHGIYAGEGTVIHFKGEDKEKQDPAVILTEIENFLSGGRLRRRNYKSRLAHDETIRIARELLSKKGYSLAFNNCEHFVTYCATGKKKSLQVRRVIGGIATITLAVTGTVMQKMITKKKVG
jgi:cell wall-associated NlpC family hydrolase